MRVFLTKTKTVLDINKNPYSCKSTFDAIMNQTRFLSIFDDFQALIGRYCCNFTFDIRTKFSNRRWLVGIDHRLDVARQEIV